MRTRPRLDRNQSEIVYSLRKAGASVQSLAAVGDGCPDLLVARAGQMYLLEIKDGMQKPSARQLTLDELRWHRFWNAPVYVVESSEQALKAIGL